MKTLMDIIMSPVEHVYDNEGNDVRPRYLTYDKYGAIDGGGGLFKSHFDKAIAAGLPIIQVDEAIDQTEAQKVSYVDVVTKELKDRVPSTAQLNGMTITNLPVPCRVMVDGYPYEITDDHLELEFDQPGTYQVIVHSGPQLEAKFTVTNG